MSKQDSARTEEIDKLQKLIQNEIFKLDEQLKIEKDKKKDKDE